MEVVHGSDPYGRFGAGFCLRGGVARVEEHDAADTPIPEHALAQAGALNRDSIRNPVCGKGRTDVASLKGGALPLHIRIRSIRNSG